MLEQELTYSSSNGAKEGTTILKLKGPFTLGNIFQLQNDLRAMKPACLIMDLSEVPYMDSAGLGVIMNYYVSAQNAGRQFFLIGINERIKTLMEVTKVDTVLHLRESLDSAQKDL